MSKYYRLTKISITGFELVTRDIGAVYLLLDNYVCPMCKFTKDELEFYCREHGLNEYDKDYLLDNAFPDNYDELPLHEKVDWLLSTSCGLEFIFEEFPDYDEYMSHVKGEVEEHYSLK